MFVGEEIILCKSQTPEIYNDNQKTMMDCTDLTDKMFEK